jgi:hypothetical protein
MILAIFNLHDEIDQFELVWKYGVQIGERFSGLHKVHFYQIFSFYVEVFAFEDQTLSHLISFDDTNKLDIYINEIDIAAMLNHKK